MLDDGWQLIESDRFTGQQDGSTLYDKQELIFTKRVMSEQQ